MKRNRVVVTGYGTANALGHNANDTWAGLIHGKNGINTISSFDTEGYSSSMAAEIKDIDFSSSFDKKDIRRYSRFVMLACLAAKEAIEHAQLDISANADRIGVEIGSGIGGIEILDAASKNLHKRGPAKVSPFTVPMMIVDMAAGVVAIKTGAKGPNGAAVTACASSAHAMGNAFRMLQMGEADAMLAGGSEAAVTPLGIASFCAARSLSTNNENPQEACCPFDVKRNGFVMGEGSAIFVLETEEHAKKRGATIYAELAGFGSTGDAYHLTAPNPSGEGAVRAMKMALDESGLKPEAIDYVNAHGTSTKLNDAMETQALKTLFGEHAYTLKISSTKSMTGHLLGAAGSLEAFACVKAIEEGVIPPTINYKDPDPELDLDYIPNKAVDAKVDVAMSNSFGFGGHNAVWVIKRYQDFVLS